MGGLQSFDFNHTDHFWDELECQSHGKPSSSSVPDGTNTFVAEWAQTPTGTLQNVVENYFCSNRLGSNLVLEWDVQHVQKCDWPGVHILLAIWCAMIGCWW